MLQREGVWNDLSPKLIEKLEAQINSFGKSVRFKFDIANPDPDPEKRAAGAIVYPFSYTLDPVTFQINDKYEDRADKQKMKKVGMAMNPDIEDGREVVRQFKRVRVSEKEKGIKTKRYVKLSAKLLVTAWTLMKNQEVFDIKYLTQA